MKLKLDFVSNSSSTSFVYISDNDFTEEVFMKAVGVDPNGPLGELFREMHHEIISGMQYGETIATSDQAEKLANDHEFTPDVIDRMKEAIAQGKSVYTGSLSSDGPFAESLLCMEMFEIRSDEFFINAFNNYW